MMQRGLGFGRRWGAGVLLPSIAACVLLLLGSAVAAEGQPSSQAEGADVEAKILAIRGEHATIDAGASKGIREGHEGTVSYELLLPDGTRRRVTVARVRVTSTRGESAEVRIVDQDEAIRRGYRVKVSVPPVAPPRAVIEAPPTAEPPAPRLPPPLPPPLPRACEGHVFVATTPSGAAVNVDGQLAGGRTPTVVQRLSCGRHEVSVTLTDHEEVQQEVVIEDAKVAEIIVGLLPQRSSVGIVSEPRGATVFIDGTRQGLTPVIVEGVAWGERSIRLEKPGFLPLVHVVRVAGPVEYSWTMTPCTGRLAVTTEPPRAGVVLGDGRLLGQTPVLVERFPCGRFDLTVSLSEYEDVQRQVLVEHEKTERVTVELLRRRSRVLFTIAPADAEVRFEGRRYRGSPIVIDNVAWGRYRVQVEKLGFRSLDEPVMVDRPGPIEYTFALIPLPPPKAALLISAFGYEAVGGLVGLLSAGVLTSEYAIELDGELVLDWRIRSADSTLELTPGDHRLRILIRSVVGREPQVFHERQLSVGPDSKNEVHVNFLLSRVTINGKPEVFNGPGMKSSR